VDLEAKYVSVNAQVLGDTTHLSESWSNALGIGRALILRIVFDPVWDERYLRFAVHNPMAANFTLSWEANYGGFGLSLPEGFFWPDLSLVIRHDFGDGNRVSWNDAISSLRPTTSLCAYYENPNLSGTIRIVVPGVEMLDLDFLGFNDIISSVINFGPP
jgi:hypothetical protein